MKYHNDAIYIIVHIITYHTALNGAEINCYIVLNFLPWTHGHRDNRDNEHK